MPPPQKRPIAQDAYDELAEAYAALVETKPHNAYYERPATLSLLPDVQGKRVLDAGCGPGVYSEWLVSHGAQVVAIDANAKMVSLAQERLGDQVRVIQANLEEPLDFLENESFDVVICPLVMEYIKDWDATFTEFHRVLRYAGCLLYSVSHPLYIFTQLQDRVHYFEVEFLEITWHGFGKEVKMPCYVRPLGEVINPLRRAGFILDQLLEPLPTEQFKLADSQEYDLLLHRPEFLCIRAIKGREADEY
jgi:ubiquinone/menaquinone biosynthesis C-methylase UbiE